VNGAAVDKQPGGNTVRFSLTNLTDGEYVLTAVAEDLAGNRSPFAAPLTVTVDTTAPAVPEFDLAPEDAAPGRPDGETEHDIVSLVGKTEPGAIVQLAGTANQTTAAADGTFRLADV